MTSPATCDMRPLGVCLAIGTATATSRLLLHLSTKLRFFLTLISSSSSSFHHGSLVRFSFLGSVLSCLGAYCTVQRLLLGGCTSVSLHGGMDDFKKWLAFFPILARLVMCISDMLSSSHCTAIMSLIATSKNLGRCGTAGLRKSRIADSIGLD
jgi:hypothetical protein